MFQVTLGVERTIQGPPEHVWSWATIPHRMTRWSIAPVRSLSHGPDGESNSEVSEREVTVKILCLRMVLRERVELSIPPRQLVYRVTSPRIVLNHRGEMLLEPHQGATRFRWNVQFATPVPGLAQLAAGALKSQLRRSVDQLELCVQSREPTEG